MGLEDLEARIYEAMGSPAVSSRFANPTTNKDANLKPESRRLPSTVAVVNVPSEQRWRSSTVPLGSTPASIPPPSRPVLRQYPPKETFERQPRQRVKIQTFGCSEVTFSDGCEHLATILNADDLKRRKRERARERAALEVPAFLRSSIPQILTNEDSGEKPPKDKNAEKIYSRSSTPVASFLLSKIVWGASESLEEKAARRQRLLRRQELSSSRCLGQESATSDFGATKVRPHVIISKKWNLSSLSTLLTDGSAENDDKNEIEQKSQKEKTTAKLSCGGPRGIGFESADAPTTTGETSKTTTRSPTWLTSQILGTAITKCARQVTMKPKKRTYGHHGRCLGYESASQYSVETRHEGKAASFTSVGLRTTIVQWLSSSIVFGGGSSRSSSNSRKMSPRRVLGYESQTDVKPRRQRTYQHTRSLGYESTPARAPPRPKPKPFGRGILDSNLFPSSPSTNKNEICSPPLAES